MRLKDLRIRAAEAALSAYVKRKGLNGETLDEVDFVDLIADLCHYGDGEHFNVTKLIRQALDHWECETLEREGILEGEQEV